MKHLLLLALFAFSGQFLIAQNNLIVFSEDGKEFILHVNGVQQNSEAKSNVKSEGITNGTAAVRIVFADESAPDLRKNMSFLTPRTEVTAKITMTKKGYKLRYFGEAPLTPESPTDEVEVIDRSNESTPVQESKVETVTETITTETEIQVNEVPSGESVQMSVGIDGFNMNVGVTVDEGFSEGTTTTTSTTTTTTVSSGTIEPAAEEIYVEEVLDSRCPTTMNDISRLKKLMETESFSDGKMNIAKQGLKGKCISVHHVMALARIFDFEDDRLEFVKFSYDHTLDLSEFYLVNSVFDFDSTKDDLNEFLESK